MLKSRGPFVLDLPEKALFDVSLMRKDPHLALEAAGTLDVPLPPAAVAKLGYEHEDMAAVYEVLAEMGGQ